MKVLIVLGGFFPAQTYGGPSVSIDNLCSLLSDRIDFFIIASDHELNSKERLANISNGWNKRKNCSVLYVNHKDEKKGYYQKIVDEVEPDVIYLNSLFFAKTTIPFLRIAKRSHIPLLLAPRGELTVNGFNKKYKKIPYLFLLRGLLKSSNVWYQSTSDEEDIQIAKILGIDNARIFRLTNVATLPSVSVSANEKVVGYCKMVFISRIEMKKNLLFALQILNDVKANVDYHIYGPLEDKEYWQRCKDAIDKLPSNIHVEYKGQLNHNEVFEIFSKHHAFLFPTLSENYGHVIVESMLVGCPIITSDQVPWTDVNSESAGWSIPLSNMSSYIDAIETLASMNEDEYLKIRQKCINYITSKLNIEETKSSYLDCFDRITKRV